MEKQTHLPRVERLGAFLLEPVMTPIYDAERLGYTFPFLRGYCYVMDDFGNSRRVEPVIFDGWFQEV